MSTSHWVCQGVGVEQGDLMPLLDGDKLKAIACDITDDEWEEENGFSNLTNEEKVGVLYDSYIEENYDWQLMGAFEEKDPKNVLICCCDGGDKYFLLYPPRYPWEENGGFTSQDEVVKYIYGLLRSYCRDDVTEDELMKIIDVDIHEHGCG